MGPLRYTVSVIAEKKNYVDFQSGHIVNEKHGSYVHFVKSPQSSIPNQNWGLRVDIKQLHPEVIAMQKQCNQKDACKQGRVITVLYGMLRV